MFGVLEPSSVARAFGLAVMRPGSVLNTKGRAASVPVRQELGLKLE